MPDFEPPEVELPGSEPPEVGLPGSEPPEVESPRVVELPGSKPPGVGLSKVQPSGSLSCRGRHHRGLGCRKLSRRGLINRRLSCLLLSLHHLGKSLGDRPIHLLSSLEQENSIHTSSFIHKFSSLTPSLNKKNSYKEKKTKTHFVKFK